MTINIYRLCNGVRGLIEPQWDRVHKLADEGNPNGFIELVDYDGMKIYDKLKQTNKRKIISDKIDELIEKGFENIILAGHSCGAWASIALAGQFPEKIKGTIATNPACRGKISDRLNDPWPAWDTLHKHHVNKFFIQPTEINSTFIVFEFVNGDSRIKVPIDNFRKLTTKLSFIYKNGDIYDPNVFRNKQKQYEGIIEISSNKLEPHRIPTFLYELSSEFHAYWNLGKDDKSKRFIDEKK